MTKPSSKEFIKKQYQSVCEVKFTDPSQVVLNVWYRSLLKYDSRHIEQAIDRLLTDVLPSAVFPQPRDIADTIRNIIMEENPPPAQCSALDHLGQLAANAMPPDESYERLQAIRRKLRGQVIYQTRKGEVEIKGDES